jgi:Domain of unknown function (DUF4136)
MKKLVLLSLWALLVAATAFAQDVRYNFDRKADFSKYKTYKWVVLKDASQVDSLVDKQIKDAIDAELAGKGLTRTEGDPADLYIGYQASMDKEKEITTFTTNTGPWGYGAGWYPGWYGPAAVPGTTMTTERADTIYVGQLALDMYDSAGQSLIWRGTVTKTLNPKASPEKRQKNLAKAVSKLLKNYPPSGK